LEYKFLSLYLHNKLTKAELMEQLYLAICHYAKRQMTWFRKMEREGVCIHWVDAATKAEDLISKFELKP
jgi:tRNA dimethylallyltransferase